MLRASWSETWGEDGGSETSPPAAVEKTSPSRLDFRRSPHVVPYQDCLSSLQPVLFWTHILLLPHPNVASTNSAVLSTRCLFSLLELWIRNLPLSSDEDDGCHRTVWRFQTSRSNAATQYSVVKYILLVNCFLSLQLVCSDKHLHDAESAVFPSHFPSCFSGPRAQQLQVVDLKSHFHPLKEKHCQRLRLYETALFTHRILK